MEAGAGRSRNGRRRRRCPAEGPLSAATHVLAGQTGASDPPDAPVPCRLEHIPWERLEATSARRGLAARLLLQRVSQLRDAEFRGVEPFRAALVQSQPLFVETNGLVEVERRILEPVGDRLETRERLLDGGLGL